jgi:type IV pilus assembly protein PilC
MINAGLPLIDALDLLKEQSEGKMATVIDELLGEIKGGKSFSEALKQYKKTFGPIYVSSVEAGEAAGVLEEVLDRLAINLEKKQEFLGKVKGAMIYPVIVIVAMVGVSFIVMTMVVPKLSALYQGFGAQMPATTRILMAVSGFVSHFFWFFPGIFFGSILVYRILLKKKNFREKVDRMKLKIPIVGPLNKAIALTEITRTLGLLVKTGVPLIDALKITGSASGNQVYQKSFEKAAARVEKGFPFSESIREEKLFPRIVAQMVGTGEETGKLDEVLIKLSRYFEVEAEQKVKGLTSAIEPLIIIVLAIGVGFLVFAVITPIYNLTNQF